MVVLLSCSGCEYFRSSRGPLLSRQLAIHQANCALVMLPGLGDTPELFSEYGFERAVSSAAEPCDVLSVDSHFGYYRDAVLTERLEQEVLTALRARYQRVWLVGVSLGGYGAVLTARAHPHLVDGVVLISPFLGVKQTTRPLVARVKAAGGLATFETVEARSTNPRRHFMEVEPVWAWLAARARDEPGPKVVMVWGEEDGFAPEQRAVGEALGTKRAFAVDGGHEWDTFARAWSQVAARAPWRAALQAKTPL